MNSLADPPHPGSESHEGQGHPRERTGREDNRAWDAGAYDRLSEPQRAWGQRVLDRLEFRGGETVMDAGCGTGRLTAQLLQRLPNGLVIAVDRSEAMLAQARSNLARFGERVLYLCADLQTIALGRLVDAVFSTAAFHWIADHPRPFWAIAAVLVPGGRLEAQCGGGPNLARLRAVVQNLVEAEPYAAHFEGWREPWVFSWPGEAAERLERAGFVDVAVSLEPAPTRFRSPDALRPFLESRSVAASRPTPTVASRAVPDLGCRLGGGGRSAARTGLLASEPERSTIRSRLARLGRHLPGAKSPTAGDGTTPPVDRGLQGSVPRELQDRAVPSCANRARLSVTQEERVMPVKSSDRVSYPAGTRQ